MTRDTRPGLGQLAPLLSFLNRHRSKLGVGFLFMLVQNYFYMRIPKQVQLVLDEVVGLNRGAEIGKNLLLLVVFTLVMAVSLFAMRALIIGVSREIEYALRDRIYTGLLTQPLSFHSAYSTGDLLSRSSSDLADVRVLLGPGIMYIPNSLSRLAFFLPVLLGLSPRLLFWVGLLLLILVTLITLLLPRLRPFFLKTQEAAGRLNEQVWQTLLGVNTIALFREEETARKRFDLTLKEYYDAQMGLARRKEILWPVFVFVFSLTEALSLLIGGRQVMAGQMTLGELLQFNLMIGFLAFPVFSIGWVMSSLQQGITAMSRINVILEAESQELPEGETRIERLEALKIRSLAFSYPGSTEPALREVSLEIKSGEILGLTGTVASGKTTLLRIIGGLETPPAATLFLDGRDAVELGNRERMKRLSYVTESPFIFSRSIAENIALGEDDPDMQRVRETAELAGLLPDLERFPDGLLQQIGERGLTLSGGQRQRVGLARALYRRAPLLLLDDPLSHVDAETEALILSRMGRVDWVRMMIIVSHRVSMLKMAGRIAVLQNGRVCEMGTHSELLARDGVYAHLAEMQRLKGS